MFPIRIPPLRERPGDIPLLVHYYVDKYAQRMNKQIDSIPEETMAALCSYSWPGNIRELQNLIERHAQKLDEVKDDLKQVREQLKNIFENDTQLSEQQVQLERPPRPACGGGAL